MKTRASHATHQVAEAGAATRLSKHLCLNGVMHVVLPSGLKPTCNSRLVLAIAAMLFQAAIKPELHARWQRSTSRSVPVCVVPLLADDRIMACVLLVSFVLNRVPFCR